MTMHDELPSPDSGEATRDNFDPGLPLPNFFMVGAPKAGTTSIYAYLKAHPDIYMSVRKEPHYFSTFRVRPEFDNFVPPIRDPREYQELFRQSQGFRAVGEASTSYLSDPVAADRIKAVVPNARIIISLRNPVERAYSHYLMECREGRETRSFGDALLADQSRSVKGWGLSLQYVELGLYSSQVERYIKLFGRSNVLVLLSEDVRRDTARVMGEVAHFLDVDPARFHTESFSTIHHSFAASRGTLARWIMRCRPLRIGAKRWIPRPWRWAVRDRFLFKRIQKPQLDDNVRRSLAEVFGPDLDRLEKILDRNLASLRDNI